MAADAKQCAPRFFVMWILFRQQKLVEVIIQLLSDWFRRMKFRVQSSFIFVQRLVKVHKTTSETARRKEQWGLVLRGSQSSSDAHSTAQHVF
jgi:Ni,Fe-hydrogenase III large subunit